MKPSNNGTVDPRYLELRYSELRYPAISNSVKPPSFSRTQFSLGSISAALSCLVPRRGRSAGSFPGQRLVIERKFSRTPLSITLLSRTPSSSTPLSSLRSLELCSLELSSLEVRYSLSRTSFSLTPLYQLRSLELRYLHFVIMNSVILNIFGQMLLSASLKSCHVTLFFLSLET